MKKVLSPTVGEKSRLDTCGGRSEIVCRPGVPEDDECRYGRTEGGDWPAECIGGIRGISLWARRGRVKVDKWAYSNAG